ncbi:hypothetical protein BJ878DRAFT_576053 [Calycina marina]|uniref:DUF7779 domain-containing protein n=1 Tax=Calycina marina TaxID=1763456 RepID=A0A9P8CEF4_9HELO|nr:hypothetical protein BJ878DRAFT_576053 [Calycina marina]
MSVSKYMLLYRQDEQSQSRLLDQESGDIRQDPGVPNSVIRTWHISFDLIKRNRPQAAELISLMAMLDRQGIPEFLLNVRFSNPLDLEDATGSLGEISLITIEKSGKIFGMHRLVQLATRKWIERYVDRKLWWGEAFKTISKAFPNGSYTNWKTCETLSPHALQVLTYGLESSQSMLDRPSLLYNMAWYNRIQGRYEVAKAESQESVTLRKDILPNNDMRIYESVEVLALVLSSQGKYADTEAMNRQALEIGEKVLGKTHPDTLTNVHHLASLLQNRHEDKEATILYQRACSGYKLSLGPEHLTTKACVKQYFALLDSLEKAKQMKLYSAAC